MSTRSELLPVQNDALTTADFLEVARPHEAGPEKREVTPVMLPCFTKRNSAICARNGSVFRGISSTNREVRYNKQIS